MKSIQDLVANLEIADVENCGELTKIYLESRTCADTISIVIEIPTSVAHEYKLD